jgi:hypothetical protein
MNENPFEVLRLDPATPLEEIVRHAGRLRQQVTDDQELTRIRQAVQELTGSEQDRLLHAMLTHARPKYRWPNLERLAAQWRRPPAGTSQYEEKVTVETTELEAAWLDLLFCP